MAVFSVSPLLALRLFLLLVLRSTLPVSQLLALQLFLSVRGLVLPVSLLLALRLFISVGRPVLTVSPRLFLLAPRSTLPVALLLVLLLLLALLRRFEPLSAQTPAPGRMSSVLRP